MANMEDLKEELTADFLMCQICFELFRKPKQLPCLHDFCFECLAAHIGRYKASYPDGLNFQCPTCKVYVSGIDHVIHSAEQWADKFPDNFVILNLMETIEMKQAEDAPVEAKEFSKEEPQMFCKKHPSSECIYFCLKHKMAACSDCIGSGGEHEECEKVIEIGDPSSLDIAYNGLRETAESFGQLQYDLGLLEDSLKEKPSQTKKRVEDADAILADYFSTMKIGIAQDIADKEKHILELLQTDIEEDDLGLFEFSTECSMFLKLTSARHDELFSSFELLLRRDPLGALQLLKNTRDMCSIWQEWVGDLHQRVNYHYLNMTDKRSMHKLLDTCPTLSVFCSLLSSPSSFQFEQFLKSRCDISTVKAEGQTAFLRPLAWLKDLKANPSLIQRVAEASQMSRKTKVKTGLNSTNTLNPVMLETHFPASATQDMFHSNLLQSGASKYNPIAPSAPTYDAYLEGAAAPLVEDENSFLSNFHQDYHSSNLQVQEPSGGRHSIAYLASAEVPVRRPSLASKTYNFNPQEGYLTNDADLEGAPAPLAGAEDSSLSNFHRDDHSLNLQVQEPSGGSHPKAYLVRAEGPVRGPSTVPKTYYFNPEEGYLNIDTDSCNVRCRFIKAIGTEVRNKALRSGVCSMAVLREHLAVVANRYDKKLTLVDMRHGIIVCEHLLKDEPWDVVAYSDDLLLVAQPKPKTLELLQVVNDPHNQKYRMQIKRRYHISAPIISLALNPQDLHRFVGGTHDSHSVGSVVVGCLSFESLKPIYTGVKYPRYIEVTSREQIVISDWGAQCVLVITMEGKLCHRLEGHSRIVLGGLTSSIEGYIHFIDKSCKQMHVASAISGRFIMAVDFSMITKDIKDIYLKHRGTSDNKHYLILMSSVGDLYLFSYLFDFNDVVYVHNI